MKLRSILPWLLVLACGCAFGQSAEQNLSSLSHQLLSGGTVPPSAGGTALTATPSNGQIPIGNGAGYTLGTITAGSNITVTNSAGGITIASSAPGTPGGTSGQLQYNNAGSFGGFTLGGDCTFSAPNITCTKINGFTFPALVSGEFLTNNGTTLSWASAGGTPSFADITSGTNTGTLTMGPGGSLGSSGGTIAATTAAALASVPANCGAGVASTGVDVNGNAVGCFTPTGSGTVNSAAGGLVACYAATGTAVSGCNVTGTGNVMQATGPVFTLPGYATASLPTCNSASKGELAYTTDGTPAETFCNGSSWVSTGGTTFTVAGTGCTPTGATGGAAAGKFTLAAGPCSAVTVTFNGAVGMPATNGWHCSVNDQTLQAAGTWFGEWGQSASTTTTATIPIPAAAGVTDVITFACTGY